MDYVKFNRFCSCDNFKIMDYMIINCNKLSHISFYYNFYD